MHFILNPVAGAGRAARAAARLRRWLAESGAHGVVLETERRGHATSLARDAARDGARAIVAVGGDGTIHEVANGILSLSGAATHGERAVLPPLGVLPIGSGNDFAKLTGGARDAGDLFDALQKGQIRRFDAGRVRWPGGEEYFINALGLGIDVEVVRQIERSPRLPGTLGYLVGLLRALARYRPIPLRVRANGREAEGPVMMVAVGNGHCLGGGFRLTPAARPDDGRLDVCMIHRLGALGIARTLPRVLRGTHAGLPGVDMLEGARIEIHAAAGDDAPSLFFELDGELREPPATRRVDIDVLPGALRVLAPGAPAQGPA